MNSILPYLTAILGNVKMASKLLSSMNYWEVMSFGFLMNDIWIFSSTCDSIITNSLYANLSAVSLFIIKTPKNINSIIPPYFHLQRHIHYHLDHHLQHIWNFPYVGGEERVWWGHFPYVFCNSPKCVWSFFKPFQTLLFFSLVNPPFTKPELNFY